MSPRVPKDTPIAVVAPSHAYDPVRLARGVDLAQAHGYDLHLLPNLLRPRRYFASPDAQRLEQLVTALTSPDFGAVWVARGGSGLTRLLDHLPYERLLPRPVVGFSDVTALHAALWMRCAHPSLIHGPVLHSLVSTSPDSLDHLFALFEGTPPPSWTGESWHPGDALGPLVGGNLCLLAALCGTPWQLDASGCVLLIEEVGELPYRIDRMLQQLVDAGTFDGVRGVALGEMVGCAPPPDASWSLRDIFLDHLVPLGVPVVADLPVGHGTRNHPFVWGTSVRISAEEGEPGTLSSADNTPATARTSGSVS